MLRWWKPIVVAGLGAFVAIQLVRRDVEDGRDELNFSDWGGDAGEADDAVESLLDGSMPPRRYTLLHRETDLDDEEVDRLVAALRRMEEREDERDD